MAGRAACAIGRLSAALMIAATASPVFARTVLFVPGEDKGFAWYARKLIARPMGDRVDRITLADINAKLESRRGMSTAFKACAVDAVTNDGIASSDVATQREIDTQLIENPRSFSDSIEPVGGRRFQVRVVYVAACDQPDDVRSALLITDFAGRLHSMDLQDEPFIRIFKRDDGKLNVFTCFECGDMSEMNYDSARDRFYYEYIGH